MTKNKIMVQVDFFNCNLKTHNGENARLGVG
jgi:hypothetical protein